MVVARRHHEWLVGWHLLLLLTLPVLLLMMVAARLHHILRELLLHRRRLLAALLDFALLLLLRRHLGLLLSVLLRRLSLRLLWRRQLRGRGVWLLLGCGLLVVEARLAASLIVVFFNHLVLLQVVVVRELGAYLGAVINRGIDHFLLFACLFVDRVP